MYDDETVFGFRVGRSEELGMGEEQAHRDGNHGSDPETSSNNLALAVECVGDHAVAGAGLRMPNA